MEFQRKQSMQCSYQQLKEYAKILEDIIPKTKDPKKLEEIFNDLYEKLDEYGLPLANIFLTTDLKFKLIPLYYENIYNEQVLKIFEKAAELFNFQQVDENLTEEFQAECNEFGVLELSLGPSREEETPEEKVYGAMKKFEYQRKFVYETSDKEILLTYKNILEETFQYAEKLYREYCSNDDNMDAVKQFFEEYFAKITKLHEDFLNDVGIAKEDENSASSFKSQPQSEKVYNINMINPIDGFGENPLVEDDKMKNNSFDDDIDMKDESFSPSNPSEDDGFVDPKTMFGRSNFKKKEINKVIPKKLTISEYINETPLKDRTSLYFKEILKEDEGIDIEYKGYIFPLGPDQIKEIQRQICGFLNAKGGRIYIGVNDNKMVIGNKFNAKAKDLTRNKIANFTVDFFPKCRNDKIKVFFIPIKNFETNEFIPQSYVIKIIVSQGDTKFLYSTTSKGGYLAHLRQPGQVNNLVAEEIYKEILNRERNPAPQMNESLFIDPEPENPSFIEKVEQPKKRFISEEKIPPKKPKERFHSPINTHPMKKQDLKNYITLKVVNINKEASVGELVNYFKGCHPDRITFFGNEHSKGNKGYGYLNFKNEVDVVQAIQKYEGKFFKGKRVEFKVKENY